ncbi:MAG: methyl-accepting chemotaxis protein [Acetatifactor sp.]|nr:methyl-accepting chemotaxis protein [Acetatifactor sp.]
MSIGNESNNKRKAGFHSIRAKMMTIILPIISAMVILLTLVSYNVSKSMIKSSSEELLMSSVASQASMINSWIEKNLATISAIKQSVEMVEYPKSEMQKVLNGYYGFESNFPNGIYIASSDGTFQQALESSKSMTDFQNTTWYQHGLTTVTPSITSAYRDEKGRLVISATGMVEELGKTIRVIGADMSLDSITVIVNSSISMQGASSFLVDGENLTILAHRDSELLGTQLQTDNGDPFLSKVAEKLGKRDYTVTDIRGNLTCFKEVGNTGWILVSYVPDKVIFADADRLGTLMLIIGALAVIILGVIMSQIIYYLAKPIAGLTGNITEMATGDFTIEVQHKGRDEIAIMGQSLANFSGSMREMIADIRQTADSLSIQSENSSTVAGEMYEAAKIQGVSMNQLKETVNQLSESVNDIASNASVLANVVSDTREKGNEADDRMKLTVEVSESAKIKMQEVGAAMDMILRNMSNLQTAINKVGSASAEITKIIGLIGDIAGQTHLLSLNASIEAARAGDAGRGFSVVAEEIGKLANTSTDSVKTISDLIDQINELVSDAVNQADSSAKNIDESSVSIKGAVDTFDEIFRNIQETNQLIQAVLGKIEEVDSVATNVAAVSEEQAASSEEILATSETMVEQANHITENSQKVADDAVELAKTSEGLSEHMSKFRIDKEEA